MTQQLDVPVVSGAPSTTPSRTSATPRDHRTRARKAIRRSSQERAAYRAQQASNWIAVLIAIVWLLILSMAYPMGIATAGWVTVTGIVIGSVTFYVSGGVHINATATMGFAVALFVGIAGVVLVTNKEMTDWIVYASLISLAVHVLAVGVSWQLGLSRPEGRSKPPRAAMNIQTAIILAPILTAVGYGVYLVEATANLGRGMIMLSPSLAIYAAAKSRSPWAFAVPAVIATWMFTFYWNGGGRLQYLALFVTWAILIQMAGLGRTRWLKLGILIALIPGLWLAGIIETTRYKGSGGLLQASSDFQFGNGLQSVTRPIENFARILQSYSEGVFGLHWFDTFWTSTVVLVPRALWPGKPIGWGAELTHILTPGIKAAADYTTASLLPSEFLWGFGYAGLVLMVPLFGVLLWWADRKLKVAREVPSPPGRIWLMPVGWAVVTSGILSLYWTGTFTFSGRIGTQLIVVMMLSWVAVRVQPMRKSSRSKSADDSDVTLEFLDPPQSQPIEMPPPEHAAQLPLLHDHHGTSRSRSSSAPGSLSSTGT